MSSPCGRRVVDGGTFICSSQEMLALDPSCMAATMAAASFASATSSVSRRLEKVRAGLWMVFAVVEGTPPDSCGRNMEGGGGMGPYRPCDAAAQQESSLGRAAGGVGGGGATSGGGGGTTATSGGGGTSSAASAMAAAFAQRITEQPVAVEEVPSGPNNIPFQTSNSNPNLSTDESTYLSDSSSGSPNMKDSCLNGAVAGGSCGAVDHPTSSSSSSIRELVILNEISLDSLSVTAELLEELLWESLEPPLQVFTGQVGLFSANSLPPFASLTAADIAALREAAGLEGPTDDEQAKKEEDEAAAAAAGGNVGGGLGGVGGGGGGRNLGDLLHGWYNRVCELTCLGEQFGIVDLVGMPLGVVCGCYEMGDAGLHQLQVVRRSGRKGMESRDEGPGEEIWGIRISFAKEEYGIVGR
eukprot:GHVS01093857.1.p1 GENE.GHVS01093857.1~~GHVS01093857.1.p1  ORF type:complete len:413 (+),score=130.61 GHVS01093857.1:301-1539(+)